jgi:hypothetical protein
MFSTTFANDLIKLILTGVAVPNLADNAVAAPLANLYLGLHSADPGPAGTQETSSLVYTGYARVAVPRLPANWVISGNVANPAARIEFPEMTGGVDVLATWLTIGTALTGAGKVLLRGRLVPDIQCRVGVIPAIKADTAITFITATTP